MLLMHEMCSHSAFEALSHKCREAGVRLQTLSRKRSQWPFPPAPAAGRPTEDAGEEVGEDEMSATMVTPPARRIPPAQANGAQHKDDDLAALYAEENEKLRAECERLRRDSLSAVMPAFHTLVEAGLLTADEVVQKLMARVRPGG